MQRGLETSTDIDFGVSGWLAPLLGIGLAFCYIILHRTEAQITGTANTRPLGYVFECVHLLSLLI